MLDKLPFIQELMAEARRTAIAQSLLAIVGARFETVPPPTIFACVEQVQDEETLLRLVSFAVVCPSLRAFETRLHRELSASASTRGKRRSRKPST
jgi:hypothetical protein